MQFPDIKSVTNSLQTKAQALTEGANARGIATKAATGAFTVAQDAAVSFIDDVSARESNDARTGSWWNNTVVDAALAVASFSHPMVAAAIAAVPAALGNATGDGKTTWMRFAGAAVLSVGLYAAFGPWGAVAGYAVKAAADYRDGWIRKSVP